jgi:hypothetical protein
MKARDEAAATVADREVDDGLLKFRWSAVFGMPSTCFASVFFRPIPSQM